MRNRSSLIVVAAIAATTGCANSGGAESAFDGGGGGDDAGRSEQPPGTVGFARDVHPIVAASCAVATCHDTATVTNHWSDYTTAELTYMRWVNAAGFDFCTDAPMNGLFTLRTTVIPGDPDASYLVEKISAAAGAPCRDANHHRRMPPEPREPLSPDSIATIVTWIREGARS